MKYSVRFITDEYESIDIDGISKENTIKLFHLILESSNIEYVYINDCKSKAYPHASDLIFPYEK